MLTRFEASGRLLALGLVAGLALLLAACEDSGTLAPTGGTIMVSANPSELTIDPDEGIDTAEATIIVQIFDEDGFPADGVSVLMTSSGGSLVSSNTCGTGGTCSRTGNACSTNADCDAVDLVTNANGRAIDVLTVTENASSPVTVTASSGMLMGTAEVAVNIVGVNQPPSVSISAEEDDPQCVGSEVTFIGSASDPDGDPIRCYQWSVGQAGVDLTVQARSLSSAFSFTFDDAGTYTVLLEVSDDPDIQGSCSLAGNPDPSLFNASDSLAYQIVDDQSDPIADAGSNQCKALGSGPVSFSLNGVTSSDPQSGITMYAWACNNQAGETKVGSTVSCSYTTTGTFMPELTVTNGCGLTASDTVTVTVVNMLTECP